MPIYEFRYVRESTQEPVTVERFFTMSEMPDAIEVWDEIEKRTYTAHRIISQTANMATNWAAGTPVSDLPDEKYPRPL